MSREVGVLFKPEMVRALRRALHPKRQTRRLHQLGEVGDIIVCREAWRTDAIYDNFPPREVPAGAPIHYEAFGSPVVGDGFFGKLRPSMFMCRWMAVGLYRITQVREQALQLIDESDAIQEGAEPVVTKGLDRNELALLDLPLVSPDEYRNGFAALWEHINGSGSWARNPTVFAHTFEEIE